MADTLITGTTLVEKESRSAGDVPIGGTIQWAKDLSGGVNTFPDNFIEANGQAITDPLSQYNGSNAPNLNTQYLGIHPSQFTATSPDEDDVAFGIDVLLTSTGPVSYVAPIVIPDGVIVTEVIVYGNAGATSETWNLAEVSHAGSNVLMASALIETADTTITNPTIDNENKTYTIWTTELATNDRIWGARIKYTSPKDQIWLIRIK